MHYLVGKNYFSGLRLTFSQKSKLNFRLETGEGLRLGLEMGLGMRVRVYVKFSISKIVKSSRLAKNSPFLFCWYNLSLLTFL